MGRFKLGIVGTDMNAADILWEDVKLTIFCTRTEFDKALSECEVHAVGDVGAILIKGTEIHCAGIQRGWLTRSVIRRYGEALIAKYGYATARISKREHVGCRLAERLGFTKVGEDALDYFYRIERLRHG